MPCLYETGVMTRMDRGIFAAYCAAYAEFVFFELQLETAEAVAVSENGFAYSNGPGRGIADRTHSDPAFDLRLSLAWLWDSVKARNGGHRIYATRPRVERTADGVILDRKGRPVIRRNGRPVKDWSDRRACPIYTPEGRQLIERHPEANRVPVLDGEAGVSWKRGAVSGFKVLPCTTLRCYHT